MDTFEFPSRLYAILDAETCVRRGFCVGDVAAAWHDAGVRLLQYRDKVGSDDAVLVNAERIRTVFAGLDCTLILNDRVHLLATSGFDGVHIGQTDGSVAAVRPRIGALAVLGISTHDDSQLSDAALTDVSYVATGPVYATGTKVDAAPVVGLHGVRAARALTRKPLVAIGGVTRATAPEVLAAGADAVAVISGLLPAAGASLQQVREAAEEFLAAVR